MAELFEILKKYFSSRKKIELCVHVVGGLGNQMFQAAFARALSISQNKKVCLETLNYELPAVLVPRYYHLNAFKLSMPLIPSDEIIFDTNLLVKDENKIYEKIVNKFDRSLLTDYSRGYFLGYWQTEKYFNNIRPAILKQFTLKVPLDAKNKKMLKKIKKSESVFIHLRLKDYCTNADMAGICNENYYFQAINYIASKIANPEFFIFSDDIETAKKIFKIDYPAVFANINDEQTDFFDLELMKHCKHGIIANSTFSWWGAWLNTNKDKLICAPKKWQNSEKAFETDIIPASWKIF